MKDVLKATFVVIGTVIGAGFASGQEIYLFFGKYGSAGAISLCLSCALCGLIIFKVVKFIIREQVSSYQDFLNKLFGSENKVLINTIHIIITLFLAISFMVMASGFGAYFSQEMKIPSVIGCSIMCVLCIIVLRKKTNGIVRLNEIVIPIMIFLIFMLGFLYDGKGENMTYAEQNSIKNFTTPLLYASYNSIVLIPILVDLKTFINTEKKAIIFSVLCSIILVILGFAVLKTVWRNK